MRPFTQLLASIALVIIAHGALARTPRMQMSDFPPDIPPLSALTPYVEMNCQVERSDGFFARNVLKLYSIDSGSIHQSVEVNILDNEPYFVVHVASTKRTIGYVIDKFVYYVRRGNGWQKYEVASESNVRKEMMRVVEREYLRSKGVSSRAIRSCYTAK